MEEVNKLLKKNPFLYVLVFSVLSFGGGKFVFVPEDEDQRKIDSLTVEMVEAKKDIIILERDLKKSEKKQKDDVEEINRKLEKLVDSHDEIKTILINMKK